MPRALGVAGQGALKEELEGRSSYMCQVQGFTIHYRLAFSVQPSAFLGYRLAFSVHYRLGFSVHCRLAFSLQRLGGWGLV